MTTPPPPSTPVPPPGGFAPGWAPSAPTGLAWATIALAGTAALFLASDLALVSFTYDDFIKSLNDSGGQATTTGGFGSVAPLLMLGAYVTLGLWGTQVHANLASQGTPQTLGKIWIWFVWWIPLAQWVMPFIYMRDLNKTSRSWALWPWYLTWTGFWVMWYSTIVFSIGLFSELFTATSAPEDFSEYVSRDDFNTMMSMGQIQTLFLVAAAVFYGVLIKQITDRHLQPQAGTPGTL